MWHGKRNSITQHGIMHHGIMQHGMLHDAMLHAMLHGMQHGAYSRYGRVPGLGPTWLLALFWATLRRMPTANTDDHIESECSVGKVSVRRVFRYPQIDAGPRRSLAACADSKTKVWS